MKTCRLISLAAACSLVAVAFSPAFAAEAGDPVAGKAKTSMCIGCHGIDGIGDVRTGRQVMASGQPGAPFVEGLLRNVLARQDHDIEDGDFVQVSSRRGTVPAVKARVTDRVRPGLLFMGYSFPDQVPTNVLTINAIDPLSGTAELKACAVSMEKA